MEGANLLLFQAMSRPRVGVEEEVEEEEGDRVHKARIELAGSSGSGVTRRSPDEQNRWLPTVDTLSDVVTGDNDNEEDDEGGREGNPHLSEYTSRTITV